jgi:hypothetical protein
MYREVQISTFVGGNHRFLNTLNAPLSINWGENGNFLSMQRFKQEQRKYLLSKFVFEYNVFALFVVGVCYYGLYLVYIEIDGEN